MNKSDIAEQMAERMGVSKASATDAVESVFEPSGDAIVRGEEVRITGSGTFASRYRPALTGRNPRGRKSPSLAASILSNFRAAKRLKDAVNDGQYPVPFFLLGIPALRMLMADSTCRSGVVVQHYGPTNVTNWKAKGFRTVPRRTVYLARARLEQRPSTHLGCGPERQASGQMDCLRFN